MKDLIFRCGSCAFYDLLIVPDGVKIPEDYKPRGNCYANPPSVFPMPKQTSTLQAMGQPQFKTVPMMMRPVVIEDERSCGSYTPVPEALKIIREREMEAQANDECCGSDKCGKDECCGSDKCGDGCCQKGS